MIESLTVGVSFEFNLKIYNMKIYDIPLNLPWLR